MTDLDTKRQSLIRLGTKEMEPGEYAEKGVIMKSRGKTREALWL